MTTKKTKDKRPAKVAVKATIAQALKKLPLAERIEVVAAVFASMGMPYLASIIKEATA